MELTSTPHTATEEDELTFESVHVGSLHSFALRVRDRLTVADLGATLRRGGFSPTWRDPLAREFQVAEGFLLPREQSGTHLRQELDPLDLVLRSTVSPHGRTVTLRPVLTVYSGLGIATVTFFTRLQSCGPDDVVFVLQTILGNHTVQTDLPRFFPNASALRNDMVMQYLQRIRRCFRANARERDHPPLLAGHIVEICLGDAAPHEDAVSLVGSCPRELYGMLAIDEGWRWVPREVAIARLARSWSTRDHLRAIALGRAILMINSQYRSNNSYAESQRQLRSRYCVPCEDYFSLVPTVAGVIHGPLLLLETCMARAACLLHIRHALKRARPRSIASLLKLRNELNERLSRFNLFGIREITLLEETILAEMPLDKAMDEVSRAMTQIESELTIRYTQSNNRWVILLTVLGVLWTAAGTIATIIGVDGLRRLAGKLTGTHLH